MMGLLDGNYEKNIWLFFRQVRKTGGQAEEIKDVVDDFLYCHTVQTLIARNKFYTGFRYIITGTENFRVDSAGTWSGSGKVQAVVLQDPAQLSRSSTTVRKTQV
jgi:hypothetical protein